jgi:Transposase DNA-binding
MSRMATKEAWTWSRAQWGEVDLGDERRERRAVAVGAALADASARSLPQQLQSRAAAKATYRLMDCEQVTHAALIEPHRQATRQAAQACGPKPVLFVQDGSYLDFTHRHSLAGVGRIGNDRGQGFCLHTGLALEAQSGRVLGLADQRFWARSEPARPESRTQRARRRTEADVWAESLEAIGPVPAGATWVSVADRGADVYSHLARARALGWHCVVRACQDRALEDGGYLLQQVRAPGADEPADGPRGPQAARRTPAAGGLVRGATAAPEGPGGPGLAARAVGGVGRAGLG